MEGNLDTNVRAVVGLARQEGSPLAPGRARALFNRAPAEIETALEPFGRYEVTVDSELDDEGDEWTARFAIDPGPPTIVARVDFQITGEGAADSAFAAIADTFPVLEGDTLLHAPYGAAKAALARTATNRGYFDAALDTAEIRVDRETATAEVVLHFSTGSRYRFGPITVEQDVLDPAYVDGYVTAKEGQPFDADSLRKSQVALTTGPWFARADIQMRPQDAVDLVVPVNLRLSPAPSQRYEVAAGYGTDTGVRASVGVDFRRLNRRAHNAELEARISQIETSIAGRYNIPRPFPSTSVYSVFSSFGDVSPTWSSTLLGTVGVSRSHLRGSVRETVSLGWEGSRYDAAGVEGDASLVGPEIEWSWTEADDRLVVTRGHRLALTLAGAHDAVLSSTSFFSQRLDAKIIRSLRERTRVLARVEVGYVSVDDVRDLPPTRRYVTGGDQTVRGYGYETLGPVDDEDRLIGGQALLVGSLEADYAVVGAWRVAVFGDAGNSMTSFSDIDLEVGVGTGIRWASPLGMLRLDLAFPVSDADSRFRVHFTIGPDL